MSMSLLVFGTLGIIIIFSIIKASIPSKETRDKLEGEKLKKERELTIQAYKKYLTEKGINFESNMDAAILALAGRENILAAIIFYHSQTNKSLSDSRKYVEKLCLSNGVSIEMNPKFGHQSILSISGL